jgi:hypothetical protein
MTTPSDNSPTETTPTTKTESSRIRVLQNELREYGVHTPYLAILSIWPGEQIMGEVQSTGPLTGRPVHIKNPKRILRLQKATPHGIETDFVPTGLDMLVTGTIEVSAPMGFYLRETDDETCFRYLSAYRAYFEMNRQQKIMEAGLIAPPTNFKMPDLRGGR